jgi:hypothetical protein
MAQLAQEEANRHQFLQGTTSSNNNQPQPHAPLTLPTTTTTGVDKSGSNACWRNRGSSSPLQATEKKGSDSLFSIDISTAIGRPAMTTSTKTTEPGSGPNLHPRDITQNKLTNAVPKAPKDACTSTNKANSHASFKGWDLDDNDDDDDDIFGGKSLMAKFRLHKKQQQQQQAITVVTSNDPKRSPEMGTTLTQSGLQTDKKGVALAFSDDDDNDFDHRRSPRRPNMNGRRRSPNDSTKDTPTPISQENSLGSSYERGDNEKSLSLSQESYQSKTNSQAEKSSDDEVRHRLEKESSPFKKKRSIDNQRCRSMNDESSVDTLTKKERPQQEIDDSQEEKSMGIRKRLPRNPDALQREEGTPVGRQKSVNRCFSDDDSDGFMSDCDPPMNSEEKPKQPSPSRNKRKQSPTMESSKNKRTKGRYDSDNDDDDDFRVLLADDDLGNDNDDLETLKPTLPNPKFGPYEPMEPLILGEHNGRQVSVPASLNRYLAPFQKQGVEFMYKCLYRRSGVILGDEMVSSWSRKMSTT